MLNQLYAEDINQLPGVASAQRTVAEIVASRVELGPEAALSQAVPCRNALLRSRPLRSGLSVRSSLPAGARPRPRPRPRSRSGAALPRLPLVAMRFRAKIVDLACLNHFSREYAVPRARGGRAAAERLGLPFPRARKRKGCACRRCPVAVPRAGRREAPRFAVRGRGVSVAVWAAGVLPCRRGAQHGAALLFPPPRQV